MSELIKPVVEIDWTSLTRYDQFEKRGWAKDENGVTYSVSAMHPEIDDWIREQNPDMYELLEYSYWFKNPELETLFLLRWS